jgi:hypothetical protein
MSRRYSKRRSLSVWVSKMMSVVAINYWANEKGVHGSLVWLSVANEAEFHKKRRRRRRERMLYRLPLYYFFGWIYRIWRSISLFILFITKGKMPSVSLYNPFPDMQPSKLVPTFWYYNNNNNTITSKRNHMAYYKLYNCIRRRRRAQHYK